jgi:hypothetical protein
MTVERVEASEQQADEAEELQQQIPQEDATYRGSPRLYMTRLKQELKKYGIDLSKLPGKTSVANPPPCFVAADCEYEEWLSAASVTDKAMPPVRLDMPGEPNYCHDCTPEFRGKAMANGTCLFTNVRFESRKDWLTKEREMVGISRSRLVTAADLDDNRAIMLGDVQIPQEAMREELRQALARRKTGGRDVTIAQWKQIPLKERITLTFPGKGEDFEE